jgi:DNA polymerase-4
MAALCRDCARLAPIVAAPSPRCAACHGPRVVAHPELAGLTVAHVDCDAFFAAIEKRDDPTLENKPVIIGGGRRGVVATACYVARTFGVRSAMPMFKALALCPEATVIRPRMEAYAAAGREIRAMMLERTPLVEPLSIDEAFLDLAGTERLFGRSPAETLAGLALDVERRVGISISIGLSHNKFLAKLASDFDKPRGFSVIGRAETLDFLGPRPVTSIWGVGAAAARRLSAHGIATIADLRAHDEASLIRLLGREGSRLHRLAHGVDDRPVTPGREVKSVSAETTFETDVAGLDALRARLWPLAERLAARLDKAGLAAAGVTLKLKDARFQTITRARALPPTRLAIRLFQAAEPLLAAEATGRAYRLIGIGVHAFAPLADADRGDMLDESVKRETAAAEAIDALRRRFGGDAVKRGIGLAAAKDGLSRPGDRRPKA